MTRAQCRRIAWIETAPDAIHTVAMKVTAQIVLHPEFPSAMRATRRGFRSGLERYRDVFFSLVRGDDRVFGGYRGGNSCFFSRDYLRIVGH
jgi:hypothetical protein